MLIEAQLDLIVSGDWEDLMEHEIDTTDLKSLQPDEKDDY